MSPEVLDTFRQQRYSKEADDALHDPGPPARRSGLERFIGETPEIKFVFFLCSFGCLSSDSRHQYRRYTRERAVADSDCINRGSGNIFTWRAVLNIGAIVLIFVALIMLFAGYPILNAFSHASGSISNAAAGIGTTNSSGQIPLIPSYRGLIDKDTPSHVLTRTGFDGRPYTLVFSDEFNTDGRTFNPGDDPYFTAVDLHYHQTNNIEWYDPGQIETMDGYLAITLSKESLEDSHNLGYLGGMLQSWNQF